MIGQSRNLRWLWYISHVCHVHQSLIHMSTHQAHTDISQAPTCHTSCTHLGTNIHVTYYVHAFTIHTLLQHTPTHSIHMYRVFIHSRNTHSHTHIFLQIHMHTACLPPSGVPCLQVQTHDTHTNTDPTNHESPMPSLPSGPLGNPTLLNSSLRQVTYEKQAANKGQEAT